jgi:hypothetical protein
MSVHFYFTDSRVLAFNQHNNRLNTQQEQSDDIVDHACNRQKCDPDRDYLLFICSYVYTENSFIVIEISSRYSQ